MEIVFAQTRYVYDSYVDLRRLFELGGFPFCYVDEIDIDRDCVYITAPINGEIRPHVKNQQERGRQRRAHIISWNLERPDHHEGSVGGYARANWALMEQRIVDQVWVSDGQLATECWLDYIILGSHPNLGGIAPPNEKRYSFVHMSMINPRRQNVYKLLDNVGENCWGARRDAVLRQSRFAVNVHKDSFPFNEPLRMALFAAYALPVVSESIYDSHPMEGCILQAGLHDVAALANRVVKESYEEHRQMGMRLYQKLCVEHEFGKTVREKIEQDLGGWR